MTSLYKCDKCGKTFTDYDECWKHESEHWTVGRSWYDWSDTLDRMTEYKEGQEEPSVVHIVFERWNSEKAEYERRCGKFKLISSYEAPLEITNE